MTNGPTPVVVGDLRGLLLNDGKDFDPYWLNQVQGTVVPLVTPAHLDRTAAELLRTGARMAGATEGLAGRLGEDHVSEKLVSVSLSNSPALIEATWQDVNFVIATADLSAALLVTTDGYSLLGGSSTFVRGAVNGGVDQARARFGRHAKKIGGALVAISERYPPAHQSWRTVQEVAPGSAVADQLALMNSVVAGEISAESFASAWLSAHRREGENGERTRETLDQALRGVFFAIEEYVADPKLRDPGELNDEELVADIRKALALLEN